MLWVLLVVGCSGGKPSPSVASGEDGISGATTGASGGASGNAGTGAGAGTGTGAGADTGTGAGTGTGTGAGAGGTSDSATSSGSSSDGGVTDGSITDAGNGGPTSSDAASWPVVTDYGAAGPFATTRDDNTGPGAVYDIFRPTMLGDGRKHPIVSWANGTQYNVDKYMLLLEHWASYGFVVIAGQTQSTAGGATIKAAIDWLIAQNADSTSPFFGALDIKAIAAAGHSQGGGATIAAGAGAPGPVPLTTTMPLMPYLGFEKDLTIIGRQTAPMGNIVATMDTTAPGAADQIYQSINTEFVQPELIGVHTDAMSPAMNAPTLAWLRFKLLGDVQARAFFYPAGTCGLCKDPAWKEVRYKNSP
jgi:Chlorophyllase enzyme